MNSDPRGFPCVAETEAQHTLYFLYHASAIWGISIITMIRFCMGNLKLESKQVSFSNLPFYFSKSVILYAVGWAVIMMSKILLVILWEEIEKLNGRREKMIGTVRGI